jgi:hypothetical protein
MPEEVARENALGRIAESIAAHAIVKAAERDAFEKKNPK